MTYSSIKKSVLLLGIFSLLCTTLSAQVAFQETSFANAQVIIQEENLPYIIYFYGKWCPSCQLMEETTFQNKKINNRIEENYVVFKVDVDSERGKEWMGIYGVNSVPTTLFYNKDSYLLNKLESPINAVDFLKITADLGRTSAKQILNKQLVISPKVPKNDAPASVLTKKRIVNKTPKKQLENDNLATIIAAIDVEIQGLKGLMGDSEKLVTTTNTLNTLTQNNNLTPKGGNTISSAAVYPSVEKLTSQIAACKSLLNGHKNIQRLVEILEDYKLLLEATPQKQVKKKEVLVSNNLPKQLTKKAVVVTRPSKQVTQKARVVVTPYQAPIKKVVAKKISNYQRLYTTNQQIIKYLKLAPPVKKGNQFIVQIGQYQNVRNAERLVQNIQDKYDYPIKVHIQKKGDKPVQVVYLGEFKTKEEAIAANENLKWINRKGVVKQF